MEMRAVPLGWTGPFGIEPDASGSIDSAVAPVIHTILPFDDVVDVYRLAKRAKPIGKIVLKRG